MQNSLEKSSYTIESSGNNLPSLPWEMIDHIGSFLDIKSLSRFARMDRGHYQFFSQQLKKAKSEEFLPAYVRAGNLEGVKELVASTGFTNENIILSKNENCKDDDGYCLSLLEYAAWTANVEIVLELLKCIPEFNLHIAREQLTIVWRFLPPRFRPNMPEYRSKIDQFNKGRAELIGMIKQLMKMETDNELQRYQVDDITDDIANISFSSHS